MHLAVIIPCLNEEATIKSVLAAIPEEIPGVDKMDVIVVDDGSTDSTVQIAEEHGASVVSHGKNLGVGAAFNTGISEAINRGCDIVVNMDGDGQFNPEDIPSLVEPILRKQADFVTASRFCDSSLTPEMPLIKKYGNRAMSRLISMLTRQRFYDVSCGFRAYSREALLRLNLMGQFTYTQETFLDLAFKDLVIMEVPLEVKGEREFGSSRVAGSISRYAFNSAKIIFRTFRDYKPLQFFGIIAAAFLAASFVLGVFFLAHYFYTGHFSGHLWAGFTSGFLFSMGIVFLAVGLLADMFVRIRKNQEKLLYYQKKKQNSK
ncbi:MAG: glycosyltransferase family 2 protein [Desulfonatronovibrionaceae bacterium]